MYMKSSRIASAEELELSSKITGQQFVDYLNSKGPDVKCSFCGVGEYGVSPNPSGDGTAIISAPAPNHSGIGVWFFPAACVECGFTILFSASFVTNAILGTK